MKESTGADEQAIGVEKPAQANRSWPKIWRLLGLSFLAAMVGFSLGRVSGGIHHLPALAATLPGDESEFNREIDERVKELFPVGTSDTKLIEYLSAQGFVPDWRERNYANTASFVWSGLLCTKLVKVIWRADADGALTQVNASYETRCAL